MQQALFPDRLEYSLEGGYSNPLIAKDFNVIVASKALLSKVAGSPDGKLELFSGLVVRN